MQTVVYTTPLTDSGRNFFSCSPNTFCIWNNSAFPMSPGVLDLTRSSLFPTLAVVYLAMGDMKLSKYTPNTLGAAFPQRNHNSPTESVTLSSLWYNDHFPVNLWSMTPLSTNASYLLEGKRAVEMCKKEVLRCWCKGSLSIRRLPTRW